MIEFIILGVFVSILVGGCITMVYIKRKKEQEEYEERIRRIQSDYERRKRIHEAWANQMRQHYEQKPKFNEKELTMLYRKLALRYHPDKAKGDKQREQILTKIMSEINRMYDIKDMTGLQRIAKQANIQ